MPRHQEPFAIRDQDNLGDQMRSIIVVVVIALSAFAAVSVHGGEAENKQLLAEIIDEALKNNPEIHALKHKLQSARARGNQSTYLEDPELNLEAWAIPLVR